MATPRPYKNGWRVHIYINGIRESKVFPTKREAQYWADKRSVELRKIAVKGAGSIHTLRDAIHRFEREVCPTHKGRKWEETRLQAYLKTKDLPLDIPLNKLKAGDFAAWKKRREAIVSAGTIIKDLGLLSSVLSYARRDWSWMEHAPLADIRRPKKPRHRDIVLTASEIRRMLRSLDYHTVKPPTSQKQRVAFVFLIALHTGMRSSEITTLTWDCVHARTIELLDTKNDNPRTVPIKRRTRKFIERLRIPGQTRLMCMSPEVRDQTFRKYQRKAGLSGFTFHDTRHTAATRIGSTVGQPGKLSFPEFCYVFGWEDPKHALIYVNPDPERLADKL